MKTFGSFLDEMMVANAAGTGGGVIADGDVLSIGANATALNGGTIKDAGTSTNATITNVEAIGTAAGSITAVA